MKGFHELKKKKRVRKTNISVFKKAFQNFLKHLGSRYVKELSFSMVGI